MGWQLTGQSSKTGGVTPPLHNRERQEAEALEAWARHARFIQQMEAEALLTAEQAAALSSEEARKMWVRTFLGSLGVW